MFGIVIVKSPFPRRDPAKQYSMPVAWTWFCLPVYGFGYYRAWEVPA